MKIIQPNTPEEWEKYYDLRWRILRAPWKQPRGSEKDPTDEIAFHVFVLSDEDMPLGAGRFHFLDDKTVQIRYMAVDESAQRRGIGKILIHTLEAEAIKKGANRVVLNARDTALPFYLKTGYIIIGKGETLYGQIPHTKMEKVLT
jgi:GNAT superfamily N-acetyltransferase